MSCAATRQGDEMYCSRCKHRWAAGEVPLACTPLKAPKVPTTGSGKFDARAFVLQHRGWVSAPHVLERMEIIARAAYAAGQRSKTK